MQWQQVVQRDPFLAGSLAAREWNWWEETTAESEADTVGLTGEQREKFLAGWYAEIAEQERERKAQQERELDEHLESISGKGDPTTW